MSGLTESPLTVSTRIVSLTTTKVSAGGRERGRRRCKESAFSCAESIEKENVVIIKMKHTLINWYIYSLICNLLYYFVLNIIAVLLSVFGGQM